MSFLQEQQFKGPVPGQGMTAEPQSRPWFNPPEISTVEEEELSALMGEKEDYKSEEDASEDDWED